MKVKQHIPAFITGPEPIEAEAETLAELRALEFVNRWEKDPLFDRWEVASGRYLMAIMRGVDGAPGKFWVVAYLDDPSLYGLPVWTNSGA